MGPDVASWPTATAHNRHYHPEQEVALGCSRGSISLSREDESHVDARILGKQ